MMVMDETSARPALEAMQQQSDIALRQVKKAHQELVEEIADWDRRIADLKQELKGFASLFGRGEQALITEFRDREGWNRIPPEQIPGVFRRRQAEADQELYNARRERAAALYRQERAAAVLADAQEVVDDLTLITGQADDVIVAFLHARGWSIREQDRRTA